MTIEKKVSPSKVGKFLRGNYKGLYLAGALSAAAMVYSGAEDQINLNYIKDQPVMIERDVLWDSLHNLGNPEHLYYTVADLAKNPEIVSRAKEFVHKHDSLRARLRDIESSKEYKELREEYGSGVSKGIISILALLPVTLAFFGAGALGHILSKG